MPSNSIVLRLLSTRWCAGKSRYCRIIQSYLQFAANSGVQVLPLTGRASDLQFATPWIRGAHLQGKLGLPRRQRVAKLQALPYIECSLLGRPLSNVANDIMLDACPLAIPWLSLWQSACDKSILLIIYRRKQLLFCCFSTVKPVCLDVCSMTIYHNILLPFSRFSVN